ncbi:hypothetical protein KIW84_031582 [Lathyrus oleraceus]|uniref:Reverse transcriptase zinc-binding domain-containing protein n=1 Tax=Pisum sativum TaxID=3888 RepID=A0A9D4XVA2_PEA|nr:hypothetical protein KIW84_031582 [Pisum sativum]
MIGQFFSKRESSDLMGSLLTIFPILFGLVSMLKFLISYLILAGPLAQSTTFIPTKKIHPWAGDQLVQDIDLNTLVQRGIALASRCYLCCAAYESFQHLFFDCGFSIDLWGWLRSLLSFSNNPFSINGWMTSVPIPLRPKLRLLLVLLSSTHSSRSGRQGTM